MALTTHDLEEAERLCHRLVAMDRGRILEGGTPPALVDGHVRPSCSSSPSVGQPVPELAGLAGVHRRSAPTGGC